jgi:hypothetical protein
VAVLVVRDQLWMLGTNFDQVLLEDCQMVLDDALMKGTQIAPVQRLFEVDDVQPARVNNGGLRERVLLLATLVGFAKEERCRGTGEG